MEKIKTAQGEQFQEVILSEEQIDKIAEKAIAKINKAITFHGINREVKTYDIV